jgi:phosphoribosylformimino-5-aminoimidazole carboxamide ribotide isomerase
VIAVPALDLREGHCVQLVGGSYQQERVRLDDPLRVASDWARMGFKRLHVVDLDAATGRGSNATIVQSLLGQQTMDIQVGGGIRSDQQIDQLLGWGARRVVVGTRAFEDGRWLEQMAARFPQRLVVAGDVRGRNVVTRGWEKVLALRIEDAVAGLNALPIAALLVTAVEREGQMKGTDLGLMEEVVRASRHPVYASGGISTLEDLRALAGAGISAAILGMALYTAALNGGAVAQEFSA